jgi:hypothetical protein
MSTQHTPAPWNAEGLDILDNTNIGILATISPENDGPSEEDYANARLIAAAPELLAALQRLTDICEADDQYPIHTEEARAAIFKATNS